jgi:hypothetical protein
VTGRPTGLVAFYLFYSSSHESREQATVREDQIQASRILQGDNLGNVAATCARTVREIHGYTRPDSVIMPPRHDHVSDERRKRESVGPASEMSMMRVAVAGTGGLARLIAHFINQETSHHVVFLSRTVRITPASLVAS